MAGLGFAPGAGKGVGKSSVRIEGLESLKKSFNKLETKSDSFMTRQFHLTAQRIAERANRDVPVDSGELLRSIKVEKGNKFAAIKVDAPYAVYVELGTKRMKAQPYILKHVQPAIDTMMKNIKRLITL